MFIGRTTELQFLENLWNNPDGQLVILYGRRRVGKTELLKQFCQGKDHIFYACEQTSDLVQRQKFSRAVLQSGHPLAGMISVFEDWETALRAVTMDAEKSRNLLLIDEFPYIFKADPSFTYMLQNLWDHVLKDQNLMVILCGSSMSFIENEILGHKNPLYGRSTGILKLEPMDFYSARDFFPEYDDEQKILAYSILGGIPYYLKQFNPEKSLQRNIISQILTPGTVLYNETEFLMREELREPSLYNAIIETIAAGSTKSTDIATRSGVKAQTSLPKYLTSLEELQLVRREFSVDTGAKTKSNRNRGSYRICDPFFKFWYSFGSPYRSAIDAGEGEQVFSHLISPSLHAFASQMFEDICMEYVRVLNRENALPFWVCELGRWMGKATVRDLNAENGLRTAETEIDVMGISADHTQYVIGECKFKSVPFSYRELLQLKAKAVPGLQHAEVYYMLFSLSGFDQQVCQEAQNNPYLRLVSLHDIVHPEQRSSAADWLNMKNV